MSRSSRRRAPSLRHRLEYRAFRGLAAVVRWIGPHGAWRLASVLGGLLYRLDARHRRIAIANLTTYFTRADGSRCDTAEAERITREVCVHMVANALELVLLPDALATRGLDDLVTIEGREHAEAARAAAGNGLVLLSGHYGNWELLPAIARAFGVDLVAINRRIDNRLIDRWVRELRERIGVTLVPRAGAWRALRAAMARGQAASMLVDQDARNFGIFVPFFGVPASTVPTPALLAIRAGAPIVTAFVRRLGPGLRYAVTIDPPIVPDPAVERDAEVARLTALVNARVEAAVRRDPAQWLWLHRRWKTAPPVATQGRGTADRGVASGMPSSPPLERSA
ncbi:MAG: lysophospholipid acyltransferase family protein [Gemmatimonadales bacterium]|jgi:KDO2-lipid IV(A) lauroyltransferase|nr:lysophospholipid acyltransferase family protein [Gemmatimonadales bacterium]